MRIALHVAFDECNSGNCTAGTLAARRGVPIYLSYGTSSPCSLQDVQLQILNQLRRLTLPQKAAELGLCYLQGYSQVVKPQPYVIQRI